MKAIKQRYLISFFALFIGSVIFTSCSSAVSEKSQVVGGSSAATDNNSTQIDNKNSAPKVTPETNQNKQIDILSEFKAGEDYKTSVRVKMLKNGWKPAPTEDSEKCGSGDSRCDEYPELESCAGTGLGNCKFLWEKAGKTAAIFTVDDPYLFRSYEFETAPKQSKAGDLNGKYSYTYTEDYGGGVSVELKNNNVAVYKAWQEDSDAEGNGAWSWDEAKQLLTVTLSIKFVLAGDDEKDSKPYSKTLIFKKSGKNLQLVREIPASSERLSGKIFKKS